jgi:hypothetical protein
MEIFKYLQFINEASLKGNIGIPGENRLSTNVNDWINQIQEPEMRSQILDLAQKVRNRQMTEYQFNTKLGQLGALETSWLDTINRESREKVAEFERTNRGLLARFGSFIENAKRIQTGKEKELSELCEKSFKTLFGILLEGVTMDFKINSEASQIMSKTPTQSKQPKPRKKEEDEQTETPSGQMTAEEIVDQKVLNEIMKRKILRTIQQGKGLNSKSLLNLPMFRDGVKEILKNNAEEYIESLNNIVKVMAFFDNTLPEAQIAAMLRNSAVGACDIEIKKEEKEETKDKKEDREKEAEKLLAELEEGKDLSQSNSKVLNDLKIKIIARGADLGVLIHESLKAVYKLATQMSLEHLPVDIAKDVLAATDTISDEPQEFKYGPPMQKQFEKVINEHPRVKEIVDYYISLSGSNDVKQSEKAQNDLAGFQEQLFFYVFGFLAALGKDDAKEMLKVVYAVLADKKEDINKLFYPIVANSVASLEQLFNWKKSQNKAKAPETKKQEEITPTKSETEKNRDEKLAELQEQLDDAVDNEEFEKAATLRDKIEKLKKESK